MAKLILKKNSKIAKEFELDDSKTIYTFGSNEKNDFVISNKNIADKHFKIELLNDSYYLEDLNSPFGTNLNGVPLLHREQIVHGDEISIDDLYLYFDNQPGILQPEKFEEEKLEIIDDNYFDKINDVHEQTSEESHALVMNEFEDISEKLTAGITEKETTQSSHSANGKSFYLLVIYGPYLGKKYPLKFGDTKIGRDNVLNDIVIRVNENGALDPSISRRHATVSYKDGIFVVTDKRSKTRTYVNQIKLDTTDEIPVNEGDEIEIVSDQQSTILRLLADENLNISPPKKAGLWWVRNKFKVGTWLAVLFGMFAFGSFGLSCMTRMANKSKPEQLKFIEEAWYQNNDSGELKSNPPFNKTAQFVQANLGLADLNGDRNVDVVFTDESGRLFALNGMTKRTIWSTNNLQALSNVSIVLSDLNANGLEDVLVVGQDIRLRALDGTNGAEIWLSPILGESISGPPAVADLNGDGLKDIIICTQSGKIHLGHGYINQIDWHIIDTEMSIHSVPSSYDLDGDGINEVLIGTDEGNILIINGQTVKVTKVIDFNEEMSKATGDFSGVNRIRYPIVLADMDQNQVVDLIMGSTQGNYLALEGSTSNRIWYEHTPAQQNDISQNLAPVVGQCDIDALADVVIVSNQGIKVLEGTADPDNRKKVLWEYNLNNDLFVTPVTLADFDNDQANDIIIGSKNGTIHFLNGINGEILSKISQENNPVISPLLVADLGSNGHLDILYIRKDRNIYKIQTNSKIKDKSIVWGQAYSNAQHTGRYEYTRPQSTGYDIVMSASGLLFFGMVVFIISAQRKRQKFFQMSQSS